MTTRRGFLKGAVAGAAALIAGVKLPQVGEQIDGEDLAEEYLEEKAVPQIFYRASDDLPVGQVHGAGYGSNIEINGIPCPGTYVLSIDQKISAMAFPKYSIQELATTPLSTTLELSLMPQPMWLAELGETLSVKLPCGIRCKGRVDYVWNRFHDDRWLVDLMLTCWNVVMGEKG